MASISNRSPALFASALFTLEHTINPAIAEQNPQKVYDKNNITFEFMPDNLLASLFIPTDSKNKPKAVFRVIIIVNIIMINEIIIVKGILNKNPFPIKKKGA